MKSQGEDGCLQLLKVRGDDKGKIATTPELNRNKNAVKLMINIYYSKLYKVNLNIRYLVKIQATSGPNLILDTAWKAIILQPNKNLHRKVILQPPS